MPPLEGEVDSYQTELAGALVVTPATRALRKELRPVTWMVLEDVALEAVEEGGRLVARTSARRVAEELGIDPSTAASALRVLRDRDLLLLERESGPAGRFGLAVYVIQEVDGLTVVPRAPYPKMVKPLMAGPRMLEPLKAASAMAESDSATLASARRVRGGKTANGADPKHKSRRRAAGGPGRQGRLEL
jgi:hypothetical protein